MADSIDGVSEYQVIDPRMPVRAHHDQIGSNHFRQPHDFVFRILSMHYRQLCVDSVAFQRF